MPTFRTVPELPAKSFISNICNCTPVSFVEDSPQRKGLASPPCPIEASCLRDILQSLNSAAGMITVSQEALLPCQDSWQNSSQVLSPGKCGWLILERRSITDSHCTVLSCFGIPAILICAESNHAWGPFLRHAADQSTQGLKYLIAELHSR